MILKVIIDRFEVDFAIVETLEKAMYNIPIVLVPGSREGDVISIIIDEDETQKRKDNIQRIMNDLWED